MDRSPVVIGSELFQLHFHMVPEQPVMSGGKMEALGILPKVMSRLGI